MDTLVNIRAFLATVQAGSFSAAARQLDVMPSVVMKRVRQLEAELNRQLFHRTTRRMRLTEAGEESLPSLKELADRFVAIKENAVKATPAEELSGHMRIKAPTVLGRLHLNHIFYEFARAHQKISLEVILLDRSVNPIEDELDIAISIWPATYRGVVEFPLQSYQRVVFASPAYLKRRGMPAVPQDLVNHDCVVFSPIGRTWSFKAGRRNIDMVIDPKHAVTDSDTLVQFVAAGLGIGLGSAIAVMPLVKKGKLKVVLPDYPVPDFRVNARIPESRLEFARVKALLSILQRTPYLPG